MTTFEKEFESCLWDGYDNNFCCVVNSNRYARNTNVTTTQKPSYRIDQDIDETWKTKEENKKW